MWNVQIEATKRIFCARVDGHNTNLHKLIRYLHIYVATADYTPITLHSQIVGYDEEEKRCCLLLNSLVTVIRLKHITPSHYCLPLLYASNSICLSSQTEQSKNRFSCRYTLEWSCIFFGGKTHSGGASNLVKTSKVSQIYNWGNNMCGCMEKMLLLRKINFNIHIYL